MAGLTDLVKNFKTLDIKQEIQVAVEKTASALADKQREQMMLGLRSTGKKIGKYVSDSYAKMKYELSSLAGYGWKDEKLTGEFQAGIGVEAREDGIVFFSADPKSHDIVEREGEDIFGLTKDRAAEYSREHLAKQANEQILKHLNRV